MPLNLFVSLKPLVSLLALSAALGAAACFASTTPSPVSGDPDGGTTSPPNPPNPSSSGSGGTCEVIEDGPASITLLGPDGGAIACDATLSIVEDGGALVPYCSPDATPHPGALPNACTFLGANPAGAPCVYGVYPLNTNDDPTGPFTIQVAQPGFEPAIVRDVHPTISAPCELPPAASQATVLLQPSPDAGESPDAD
jgi:hypothetical protein